MSKALLDTRAITDLAIESAAADLVCQLGAGAKTVAVAGKLYGRSHRTGTHGCGGGEQSFWFWFCCL